MSFRPVSLRREWNSWAPISRLPPELLSLTFWHVRRAIGENGWQDVHCRQAFEPPIYFHERFEVKGWMKILHVCHAWREVAMNTISLWSNVVATRSNYKWAEECLRRSKPSSLALFANFQQVDKEHPSRTLLRELRNHVGRCRVLSLHLTTGDLIDLLSQTETPHLVQLSYCHSPNSESPPLIGDSILRADSLRRLLISSCPIDWRASIFRRLTHLQLNNIPNESRLKCHAFVSFLLDMPSLEALDLCAFLQSGQSDASHPVAGKVNGKHLRNLKHVELSDNPLDIADFLSSLVIPPFCKVFINVEGHPATIAEEFLPILSWVDSHFQPPKLESSITADTHHNYWRSLRIYHLGSFQFGYQGYTIEENLESDDFLFDHCILPPESLYHDYDYPILPQPLFTQLPISHIVYLEVSSDYDWPVLSRSMWTDIFGSIPTLKSICIEAKSLPFFEALSHSRYEPDFIPFPVLSSVIVRGDYHLDCDTILSGLRWRFQLGAPLKELDIKGCPKVPYSVLEQLRKVVGQVIANVG